MVVGNEVKRRDVTEKHEPLDDQSRLGMTEMDFRSHQHASTMFLISIRSIALSRESTFPSCSTTHKQTPHELNSTESESFVDMFDM